MGPVRCRWRHRLRARGVVVRVIKNVKEGWTAGALQIHPNYETHVHMRIQAMASNKCKTAIFTHGPVQSSKKSESSVASVNGG